MVGVGVAGGGGTTVLVALGGGVGVAVAVRVGGRITRVAVAEGWGGTGVADGDGLEVGSLGMVAVLVADGPAVAEGDVLTGRVGVGDVVAVGPQMPPGSNVGTRGLSVAVGKRGSC
jgi:hypothetical protein